MKIKEMALAVAASVLASQALSDWFEGYYKPEVKNAEYIEKCAQAGGRLAYAADRNGICIDRRALIKRPQEDGTND